ncbi:MAG: type II secretion system F family protein, partial [Lachnospiraceae bacterium]|nr:type II secretion system F family protein [Lachnospiraceae bacterium]
MKQRNRNGARKWILGRSRPLKPLELSEFSRELGTMLQSGIPISRALDILSGEAGLRSRTREQYEALLTGIRRGEPPSQVMEEQNGAFPPLMISMFRAAESAGNLDRTALRLAEHYRREHRQRAQVAGALLYPKFLLALLILTAGLLTGFVLPQFASLFEWMDELPLPTRILYGVTGLVSERWYLIPAGAAAALFLWRAVSSIPFVREGLDRMKLHLPVLGGLLRTVYTAR